MLLKVRESEARAPALLGEPVARLPRQQASLAQMFRLILRSRTKHFAMAQFDFIEPPQQDMTLASPLRTFLPIMYLKNTF